MAAVEKAWTTCKTGINYNNETTEQWNNWHCECWNNGTTDIANVGTMEQLKC